MLSNNMQKRKKRKQITEADAKNIALKQGRMRMQKKSVSMG